MDILHGLLLLVSVATLVATLAIWKQRLTPLLPQSEGAQEAAEDSQPSSLEPTTRKMRVSVLDDQRAAMKERKEREATPNESLQ